MTLPHENLNRLQNNENALGTDIPTVPQGVFNRPLNELLENDIHLQSQIDELKNETLPDATTSEKGIVQLSSSTNSVSETQAATSKAISDIKLQMEPKIVDKKSAFNCDFGSEEGTVCAGNDPRLDQIAQSGTPPLIDYRASEAVFGAQDEAPTWSSYTMNTDINSVARYAQLRILLQE